MELPSPDLRLSGLIPFGELADGNDAVFLEPDDLNALPELVVTGHDAERRRLLLGLRERPPLGLDRPHFRTGQVIPVRVVVRQESSWLVRWAAGNLLPFPKDGLPEADLLWARVEEFDPGARHLRLAYSRASEDWTVTAVASDSLELRADDGATVRVERSDRLRHLGPADRVRLALIEVVFRLGGPRIYCRPLSDLSAAREFMRQEAVRPVTLVKVQRKPNGYVGQMIDLEVFLPFKEVALTENTNFADYLGQSLPCRVVDVNENTGRIIVSQRKATKKKLVAEFEPGQIRKGVVTRMAPFGAFVDLGGIDGLLHRTEMSWQRVTDPNDIAHIGQQLKVYILSVDKEKEKIALSLKPHDAQPVGPG